MVFELLPEFDVDPNARSESGPSNVPPAHIFDQRKIRTSVHDLGIGDCGRLSDTPERIRDTQHNPNLMEKPISLSPFCGLHNKTASSGLPPG